MCSLRAERPIINETTMPSKKSKKPVLNDKKLLNTDAGGLTDKVTQVVDYGEIPSNTPPTPEKETKK